MTPKAHEFFNKNTVQIEDYPIQEFLDNPGSILKEVLIMFKSRPKQSFTESQLLTCTIALNEFAAFHLSKDKSEDTIRGMLDSLRVIFRVQA